MKTNFTITVKNKIYPYSLSNKTKGLVSVVCEAAKINQDFLAEDVPELLMDLPNLIIAEQKYKNKSSQFIRFRISDEDKKKIEKNAIKRGYDSVSKYLRDIALKA